jgi:hypothetical protein
MSHGADEHALLSAENPPREIRAVAGIGSGERNLGSSFGR